MNVNFNWEFQLWTRARGFYHQGRRFLVQFSLNLSHSLLFLYLFSIMISLDFSHCRKTVLCPKCAHDLIDNSLRPQLQNQPCQSRVTRFMSHQFKCHFTLHIFHCKYVYVIMLRRACLCNNSFRREAVKIIIKFKLSFIFSSFYIYL